MSKHTPGPWKISKHYQIISSALPEGTGICRLIADEREGANPDANANLIAAAPEMLEALKKALTAIDMLHRESTRSEAEARALVYEAIAKAEGDEK